MISIHAPTIRVCVALALASWLSPLGGCAAAASRGAAEPQAELAPRTISLIATNDFHGNLERAAVLGGYLSNLRQARARDGAVLLLDAGDMFQGTIASNLSEGAAVVRAYNRLGYHAAAVGNHEFDYGPIGPAVTATQGDDPRGALLARAAQAEFPILAANLRRRADGEPIRWTGIVPRTIVSLAGIRIGLVGISSIGTLEATLASNVADLQMASLDETVLAQASLLRAQGAQLVIVLAHVGGGCTRFEAPESLDSCELDSELFELARALPAGSVDAIVGGHTHQAIAHRVAGIPVIESFAHGRAFGRIDLRVDPETGRLLDAELFAPQELCAEPGRSLERCEPGPYEGREVEIDAGVLEVIRPDLERAEALGEETLGVESSAPIATDYPGESPLGNLFADLIGELRPGDEIVLLNAGGVRADLPAGPLRYGDLYRAFPFDNRVAEVHLSGAELREALRQNLIHGGGVFLVSGLRVEARCVAAGLEVRMRRPDGREIRDEERLRV
ncbi:MAG: bifunctional metallophosphatase/5'-nucleotidase, partial [Myxococcales bacterium]|nr:bifunctional metallophosphatase/5'-nucleotidase [Myxococcales bacterium]